MLRKLFPRNLSNFSKSLDLKPATPNIHDSNANRINLFAEYMQHNQTDEDKDKNRVKINQHDSNNNDNENKSKIENIRKYYYTLQTITTVNDNDNDNKSMTIGKLYNISIEQQKLIRCNNGEQFQLPRFDRPIFFPNSVIVEMDMQLFYYSIDDPQNFCGFENFKIISGPDLTTPGKNFILILDSNNRNKTIISSADKDSKSTFTSHCIGHIYLEAELCSNSSATNLNIFPRENTQLGVKEFRKKYENLIKNISYLRLSVGYIDYDNYHNNHKEKDLNSYSLFNFATDADKNDINNNNNSNKKISKQIYWKAEISTSLISL
jgi:hypothetical protein